MLCYGYNHLVHLRVSDISNVVPVSTIEKPPRRYAPYFALEKLHKVFVRKQHLANLKLQKWSNGNQLMLEQVIHGWCT